MNIRIKYLLSAAAICLALAFPTHMLVAGDTEDARSFYDRGAAALRSGDARTARIELMNAVKADPQWASARFMQAQALLALRDGAGAQADIARARELGIALPLTRHLMAEALLLQGRADEALAEATSADVDTRFRAEALRMAGRAHQALGQLDEAGHAFDQMLELAPNGSRGWADIARYRLAQGDQGEAIAAADRAVQADPRDPGAIVLRGTLVRSQYGLKASLPWFARALTLDRNNVPALTEFAATLAELGQAKSMLALTRRIIALEPGNARAFFMQAVVAARAGEYGLARKLLERTGGRMNDVPAVLLLSGALHLDAGNYRLAAERFERLLIRQPFNMEARQFLGAAQYQAGNAPAAAATLQPLVERGDADSYSLTLAARVHEALDDQQAAVELLDRASLPVRGPATVFAGAGSPALLAGPAFAAPGSAPAAIPYIRALLETGQLEDALRRARMLEQANPNAPAAHILYGDALFMAGRSRDAAEAYKKGANIVFSESTALRLVAAYRQAGDPESAVNTLNLYLSQNPFSLEANRLAAAVQLEMGHWTAAIRTLESLRQRIGYNDPLLLCDLSWARLNKGDAKAAMLLARRAYALQPSSPVASDAYGWALFKAEGKSSRAAIDLLEKAVAISPRHPLLNLHLGEVYARAGLKVQARRVLMVAASTEGFGLQQQAKALLRDL